MSTLTVATVKSNSSSPPAFQNTSGTEIGRLCRAFVNFDGTGTVSIRAQYNVSSITDNGVGNYTINFTTAMADTFYAVVCSGSRSSSYLGYGILKGRPSSTTACPVYFYIEDQYYGEGAIDGDILCVSIFR